MARFPAIDQPCPLGIDEQRRLDGHCSRCETTVHDLTALEERERIAFVRAQTAPVCVSYRVGSAGPRRAGVGLGAALAITVLAAQPAIAGDPLVPIGSVDRSSQSLAEPANDLQRSTAPVKPACATAEVAATADAAAAASSLQDEMIFAGGVSDPANAVFVDVDDGLAELPMIRADDPPAAKSQRPSTAPARVRGSR